MQVLVAVASRVGFAEEIALELEGVITRRGMPATVRPIERVTSLDGFDIVAAVDAQEDEVRDRSAIHRFVNEVADELEAGVASRVALT